MDIWETIRIRCVRDREPIKRVARELGVSKNTVKKYIASLDPPVRSTTMRAPASSMTAFEAEVDRWLCETPKITSSRIVQLIRTTLDPTFRIGERAGRAYVASRRGLLLRKEAFVRLVYAPGDQVQIDFKDVVAKIDGVEIPLHLFTARLSYSTALFAKCYRTEDRPALFDGIVQACVWFGGLPREGVFDNATTAITKVLRGRDRQQAPEFAALCGSLALPMQFAAPAKGNEKGGVEGAHGFVEDNFFRPMPAFSSMVALNAELDTFCKQYLTGKTNGKSIADRFAHECQELRPLPEHLPDTCVRDHVRINKFGEVLYKTNRYSVPTQYVHQDAILEAFHDRVRIVLHGSVVIAEHARLFGRREASLDIKHFLELLSRKHRAVLHAEVFQTKMFNATLRSLLSLYADEDPDLAGKRFMRVLRLLERHRMEDLADAVDTALRRGTSDPAAIELIMEQEERQYHPAPPLLLEPGMIGTTRPLPHLDSYDLDSLKESLF